VKGERLGEFEELVLLCVRQLAQDANGVEIQGLLAESAAREVSLGAIYAALDRAQRKGFVESWLGEPTPVRGGRRKRHYGLTEDGRIALEETRRIREVLWDPVGDMSS
jgi:DNA-binding PadR family transcriptional regulator